MSGRWDVTGVDAPRERSADAVVGHLFKQKNVNTGHAGTFAYGDVQAWDGDLRAGKTSPVAAGR